ncbi:uncharacterized protein JCM15063_002440 [Sporobolomyces koalae]|uniref:uncharacterized protein n=1 Tax=Sporobolomyces koalae TaxID=500713 RepID=UPI0031773D21
MWNSLSESLSGYLNSSSRPPLDRSTVDPPQTPLPTAYERVATTTDLTDSAHRTDSPHTPDHSSRRLSPNTLSASGNQTMAGVLAAHPQFSVFKKSASQRSLAASPSDHSAESAVHENATSDEDQLEIIATPPLASPRSDADKRNHSSSSSSSSFNFSSLDGADLPSLNFGDHSSTGSLVAISPRASPNRSQSPPPSTLPHNETSTSGVRLVPDSPPSTSSSKRAEPLASSSNPNEFRRPSSSSSSSTRTPSRSSSSSSLSRSQSVARVGQFSPLSLCPSPLIGAPVLPPPPPHPVLPLEHTPEDVERLPLRRTSSIGILKPPRTPGTGRSVRFTASIIDHGEVSFEERDAQDQDDDDEDEEFEREEREESPSISHTQRSHKPQNDSHTLSRTESVSVLATVDQTESALDLSAITSRDSQVIAKGHSSFLDKLQEIIPSPDTSVVEVTQIAIDEHVSSEKQGSIQTSSSDATIILPTIPQDDQLDSLTTSVQNDSSISTLVIQPPHGNLSNLFDESNPCHLYQNSNTSISILGASTLGGIGGGGLGIMKDDFLVQKMEVVEEEAEEEIVADFDQATDPTTPRKSLKNEPAESYTPTRFVNEDEPQNDLPGSQSDSPEKATIQEFDGQSEIVPLASPTSKLVDPNYESPLTTRDHGTDNQSFYRRFMASRAQLGQSQTAMQEWNRLESGEKASPKEEQTLTEGIREGHSVYYSPLKSFQEEGGEEETGDEEAQIEQVLVQGGSFYELAQEQEEEEEEETYGGMVQSFLSPIVELSEPESTANSPIEELVASLKRSHASRPQPIPPLQPTFSQTTRRACSDNLANPATRARLSSHTELVPSTPESNSKIPRLRACQTTSFDLSSLAFTRVPGDVPAVSQQAQLIQELVSTQQTQLSTSNSQRGLLSNLVANLQEELERKDRIVNHLKQQVVEARREVEHVERIALESHHRRIDVDRANAASERERRKVLALEETARLLADELDTRLRDDSERRRRIDQELCQTRSELNSRIGQVRQGEIRLRHAQANQAKFEAQVKALQISEGDLRDQVRASREQVELVRTRWQVETEERDRTTRKLRGELFELKQNANHSLGRPEDEIESRIELEVQRRVEEVRARYEQETVLVKRELVLRDEALADLRAEIRTANESVLQVQGTVHEDRQQAELARAQAQTQLVAKEEELVRIEEFHSELQDELDETIVKLENSNLDRTRLIQSLDAKEIQLGQQQERCSTAIAAMRELEQAVIRIEAESVEKDAHLERLEKQVELQANTLEQRERVIADSEQQLSQLTRDKTALRSEKDRVVEVAEKLKRDSADREIRISKLKKRIAELDEDVFGLNIALDAKQQEASHWKRQMSQLKLELAQTSANSNAEAATPSIQSKSTKAATSTVRRFSTASASVLAGLDNHTLSRPATNRQETPLKKAAVSRRRSSIRSSVSTIASNLTVDQGPEETPSRPVNDRIVRRSTSSTSLQKTGSNLRARPIEFPELPPSLNSQSFNRRTSLDATSGMSKENQPIRVNAPREAVLV